MGILPIIPITIALSELGLALELFFNMISRVLFQSGFILLRITELVRAFNITILSGGDMINLWASQKQHVDIFFVDLNF